MNPAFSRAAAIVLGVSGMMTFTGCLKSRLQIRDEEKDGVSRPVPAQVQEVAAENSALDDLKLEFTHLTGRVEDLERSKKDSAKDAAQTASQREEVRKLESRIVELEQAQFQMLEAIKKMQQEPRASASHVTAAATPSEAFDRAKAQFDANNLDAAVETLTAYLKTPKAAKAEEAVYLRGESYFRLKQFKKAIVDYSKFPEKYSKSKRMPGALLKIGLSFEALGMKDDAKGFFQELIDKYPKSAEAKKARAKVK